VYYYQSGMYRKDYQRTLASALPSFYHVEDSWDNFEKMSEVITSRYEEWKKAGKTIHVDTPEPIEA
jgi:hypothetical protein